MQFLCSFKRFQAIVLVLAAFTTIAVLMILFFFNYPSFARQRVIESVVFSNNSQAMGRFKSTQDLKNLRLSFYLYNVTNADEIVKNPGLKFNLKEIGPFVYHELKVKELVNNNQTSGEITYKLRRRYDFEPNLSIADPAKVLITWPNVPLLVARAFLDNLGPLKRQVAYLALNTVIESQKEPAFIVDSVQNFLFDGSKRKFFEYLESKDIFKLIKPWPLEDNMFALMYKRNNTWNPKLDRLMTTSAGFGGNQTYRNLNQFLAINSSTRLPFWRNNPPDCNRVGGTDGEFFSPFIDNREDIEVYSIDICRKLKFKFNQTSTVNGISALKYTLNPRSLQSYLKNPDNQCYCISEDFSRCELDGLIDLSNCNFPNVVASGAHFFNGSPELIDRVSGLSLPNDTLHEPEVYVEPNTGITVEVRVPLQFNIRIDKGGFKIFDFFTDNKTLILPLVQAVESIVIADDQANLLRSKLLLLDSWLVTMVLGGAISGIIVILVIAIVLCIRYRDSRAASDERTPLLSGEIVQPDTHDPLPQPNSYRTV